MNQKSKPTILIVDDEPNILSALTGMIEAWGYNTLCAFSGSDGLNFLDHNHVDLILSDQVMPGMDGLALLEAVKEKNNDLPFIMLTGHGAIDKAVIAMKNGATDYLLKPCKPDELQRSIERAIKFSQLNTENQELKRYFSNLYGFEKIITRSSRMRHAMELAAKVARIPNAPVTIFGESGTGKELLARSIHHHANCLDNRFISVNCAAIPSPLLESELFGHVKGAFTGAIITGRVNLT
jgi:DNA-binding NtrC family response regulator